MVIEKDVHTIRELEPKITKIKEVHEQGVEGPISYITINQPKQVAVQGQPKVRTVVVDKPVSKKTVI